MSSTPLSDLIQSFHETKSGEDFDAMLSLFLTSNIGVKAFNVPDEYQGKSVVTKGEGIGLANTSHGDGVKRVLAFADPQEFIKRFGPQCNGEMTGKELIKVALHNADCQGVLLNSAIFEISTILPRPLLQSLHEPAKQQPEADPKQNISTPSQRKWWEFWK